LGGRSVRIFFALFNSQSKFDFLVGRRFFRNPDARGNPNAMASRGLDYDYGTRGSGAGGKIRRRPASRSVAASPYARPAPAPALATATASASQGRGWFSRLISAGASRLLPSLFRKPPPQLAAPPPPLEPIGVTTLRPEASQEPLLLRQDVGPAFVPTQPELSNAPPSPPPPPLGICLCFLLVCFCLVALLVARSWWDCSMVIGTNVKVL
jgi:hypothetical protein